MLIEVAGREDAEAILQLQPMVKITYQRKTWGRTTAFLFLGVQEIQGRGTPSAAEILFQGAIMSVKKEASERRSVQVEVEVPGSTQSAVARRSAEAQLRTLIAKFAPAHLRLIGAMRRSLRKRLPTAHEVVYEYRDCFVISYSPNEHGYEGVLAIRASADGVKLYFNRVRNCRILRNCCRGPASRRAGFTWRARPHSLVRRSRA